MTFTDKKKGSQQFDFYFRNSEKVVTLVDSLVNTQKLASCRETDHLDVYYNDLLV